MEKRNSQLEHGQPMEQTRGLFCTCDSGQSQHQYHLGRMNSMFEAYCTGKYSLMNDLTLIDSCQAHLPVQYASNIEFTRQKCCD